MRVARRDDDDVRLLRLTADGERQFRRMEEVEPPERQPRRVIPPGLPSHQIENPLALHAHLEILIDEDDFERLTAVRAGGADVG